MAGAPIADASVTDLMTRERRPIHLILNVPPQEAEYILDRPDVEPKTADAMGLVRATLQDALEGDERFWGYEFTVPVSVCVATADGRPLVLGCHSFRGRRSAGHLGRSLPGRRRLSVLAR